MVKDDKRQPTKPPKGGARPEPKDSDQTRQMALGQEIMDEDHELLKELSK